MSVTPQKQSGLFGLQASALHEEYVAFVRHAKIGWWVVASLVSVPLLLAERSHVPLGVTWVIALTLPLIPCARINRDLLRTVVFGDWSERTRRHTIAACALSCAAIVAALAVQPSSLVLWGWWISPLVAACAAVVFNGWLQTRADQLGGFGFIAAFVFGNRLIGASRSGLLASLCASIPVAAAAWLRMTTGSLLSCFFVYLFSEELLWLAFRAGIGHR